MKHLGDITKLKGTEVPIVDIVCGGQPVSGLVSGGQTRRIETLRKGR